jgi:hypothetical protein
VLAKASQTSTTAGATKYRASSKVKGSGIEVTGAHPGRDVAASKLDGSTELVNLGVMRVPGVEVPDLQGATGYGDEALDQSQTTQNGYFATTYGQSITLEGYGRILSRLTLKVDMTDTLAEYPGDVYLLVMYDPAGDGVLRQLGHLVYSHPGGLLTATDIDFTGQIQLPKTCRTVYVGLQYAVGTFVPERIYRKTSEGYSGGAAGSVRAVADGTFCFSPVMGDLYFKAYSRVPLGFSAWVEVDAACSESGKVATLRSTTLLPGDFCELVTGTFAAGRGALIDNIPAKVARRRLYLAAAGAGNVAPASGYTRAQPGPHGLYLPPGDSEVVPIGEVQPGDRLLVRPGEVVPVDGVVRGIAAVLDEAALTGESRLVTREDGDTVS